MTIIAIIMLVLALLGMILFDAKIIFCILMILCAACLLAYEPVLKKMLPKENFKWIILAASVIVFLLCALLPGSRIKASGYETETENVNDTTADSTEEIKSDEEHYEAARAYLQKNELDEAKREFDRISEENKNTEEYYINYADYVIERWGGTDRMNDSDLYFFRDVLKEYPDSMVLNYKAGIVAYAVGKYILAENCLYKAFELSPDDDPYTPYALAATYLALEEEEYAYAMMTVAEKNGILESGECEGEGLVDWYLAYKEKVKEMEAAQ